MRRNVKFLIVVLLAVAAVAALPAVWRKARAHPYFRITEIVVGGTERLRRDEILAAAGVRPGASIWAIDPVEARERLLRHPWVRAAVVRRELPRRVVVKVQERRPVAVVVDEARLFYLAGDGAVFAPVADTETPDLPCVTGLLGSSSTPETVTLRGIIEFLGALGRARWPGQLSEIHLDEKRGLIFYPVGARIAVVAGWGDWDAKLGRLQAVMERWAGREHDLAEVDLRFRDQVVVRKRPGARPVSASGVRI